MSIAFVPIAIFGLPSPWVVVVLGPGVLVVAVVIWVVGIRIAVVTTRVHVAAVRRRDGHAHTIVEKSGGFPGWTAVWEHGSFPIIVAILGVLGVEVSVVVMDRHLDSDRFVVRVRVADGC